MQQREKMRRSVVVVKDLKAGDVITREVLDVKRPGTGIAPAEINDIIGYKVNRDIEADTILNKTDLEQ